MRPPFRVLLATVFAIAWSGVAAAETPDQMASLDAQALEALHEVQLDDAFERSTNPDSDRFLARLGRPTTMDCSPSAQPAGLETCIVTAPEQELPPPASLAHR